MAIVFDPETGKVEEVGAAPMTSIALATVGNTAVPGSDGTLGGPGGTPLSPNVLSASERFVQGNSIDLLTDFTNTGPGSDNTTELQAAINQLAAAGGGDIFLSKPGAWGIDGAVQTGSNTGAYGTSSWAGQLLFPSSAAAGLSIRIRGTSSPSWFAGGGLVGGGAVLQSNASSGAMFAVQAPAPSSPGLGGYSAMMVCFQDLVLECATGGSGIDMINGSAFDIQRVILKNSNYPGDSSFGLRNPKINSGDQYMVRDFVVQGFHQAVIIGEVAKFLGLFGVLWSDIAVQCNGGGDNLIYYLNALATTVLAVGNTNGIATQLSANILWQPGAGQLISDPIGNLVNGTIRVSSNNPYYLKPGQGQYGFPSVNGGSVQGTSSADIGWVGLPGTLHSHPQDSFARTNAPPTVSGAAGYPGSCDHTLHPWRVAYGAFSITQQGASASAYGQLFSTTSSGTAEALIGALDGYKGGRSRSVTATLTLGATIGATGVGITAHQTYGGANPGVRLACQVFHGTLYVYAGNTTVFTSSSLGFVGGGTYTLSVQVNLGLDGLPSRMRILLGGVVVYDYWLPAAIRNLFVGGGWPVFEDGVLFSSDTTSYITSFVVEDLLANGDPTGVVASVSATHTALTGETTICTANSFTVTLPTPALNAPANRIVNTGTGTITIAPPSGALKNLATGASGNITLAQGVGAVIISPDGTNFQQVG